MEAGGRVGRTRFVAVACPLPGVLYRQVMLIKYRIARMQPPSLFGRVLHVTLVTPNTADAAGGTTVAAAAGQAWTMLLLVKRLLCLASAFSNLVLASISRIIRGHCRNVDIAFEAV